MALLIQDASCFEVLCSDQRRIVLEAANVAERLKWIEALSMLTATPTQSDAAMADSIVPTSSDGSTPRSSFAPIDVTPRSSRVTVSDIALPAGISRDMHAAVVLQRVAQGFLARRRYGRAAANRWEQSSLCCDDRDLLNALSRDTRGYQGTARRSAWLATPKRWIDDGLLDSHRCALLSVERHGHRRSHSCPVASVSCVGADLLQMDRQHDELITLANLRLCS